MTVAIFVNVLLFFIVSPISIYLLSDDFYYLNVIIKNLTGIIKTIISNYISFSGEKDGC